MFIANEPELPPDTLNVWTSTMKRARQTAKCVPVCVHAWAAAPNPPQPQPLCLIGCHATVLACPRNPLTTPPPSLPRPKPNRTEPGRRRIKCARYVEWRSLREIEVGVCDGLSYDQVKESFPNEYKAREQDKLRYRYPRGESYMDIISRLESVIFGACVPACLPAVVRRKDG